MRLAARTSLAAILAFAPLLVPAASGADDETRAPGVAVRVDSIPATMRVRVERPDGQLVLECFDACSTVVDPGGYRLRLQTASGETIGTQSASIRRDLVFHATNASPGAATTGLVLGIAGTTLLATGLVALALTLSPDGSPSPAGPAVAIYGLTGLAMGAVLTPVGWVMFAHNRHLFRTEKVKDADATRGLDWRVGVAPLPGGASGALVVAF
jgi:xanthosine utilization system XapX-like protein